MCAADIREVWQLARLLQLWSSSALHEEQRTELARQVQKLQVLQAPKLLQVSLYKCKQQAAGIEGNSRSVDCWLEQESSKLFICGGGLKQHSMSRQMRKLVVATGATEGNCDLLPML